MLAISCGAGGVETAWRIVRYNVSGIDDAAIFPQRTLDAARLPFRFERVAPGGEKAIALSSLSRIAEANDTLALLVIRDDRILLEEYFQDHHPEKPVMAFSVAKSVLSLLIGIAIEDGQLESEETRLGELVPGLRSPPLREIPLRALLQMTSGIDYAENDNPFGLHPRFYYSTRLRDDALSLEAEEVAEQRFEYRSSDAVLLTLALEGALHSESVTQFTQRRLWNRVGMEHDGAWRLDNPVDGIEKTGCCLSITARDLAKIGRLYLKGGDWDGDRIIAAAWAARPQRSDRTRGASELYQYMWWRITPERRAFAAIGHLGRKRFFRPPCAL